MSIRLMNDAWDTDLQGTEKLVLLTLCDFANDEGRNCYPSVPTVAAKASLSERQTQRVLHALEASTVVSVSAATASGGRGVSKHYTINVRLLASMAADARARREALKGDNLSPFPDDQKGDTDVTLSGLKRVTSETERVTPVTQKGDTGVTRSVINPKSNQREACAGEGARESENPPSEKLTAGERHGMPASGPEPQIEFPDDWQPDQRCRDVLAGRKIAWPAQFVIDAFAVHWQGRWIEPRRIANEFAKWVLREAGMRGGKVPTDADGVSSKADAEAAWLEVREAFRSGKLPKAWRHPGTQAAIDAIGGNSAMRELLTSQAPFKQREFVAAFLGRNP